MGLGVVLNLVFLVPGETGGMETYARELVPRLARAEDLDLTLVINREAATERELWTSFGRVVVAPVEARSRVQWVRGEQLHVARVAERANADLIHSLASTAPLWGSIPRVTTIHDLNFLVVPEAHFGVRAHGMRVLVGSAARRSTRLMTDSESTRDDIVARLGVPAERIDVVPLGVTKQTGAPTQAAELRVRLALGSRPVVLVPGAKRPHKNALGAFEALAGIPLERRPALVLTGYATPYEDELRAAATRLGIDADVVITSWLSEADLDGLYALAELVVFPSFYEGFGLPVLEAMVRGVPVVTSDRSSLPEVAGDAALLVDPGSPDAIRAAIERLLADPDERERLRRAGLERAARFTWDRTAELTLASYRRTLSVPPRR